MVRKETPKDKIGRWKMQNLVEAIENGMFVRTVATNFKVPRMTLKRLIKKKANGVLPK